jgi:hypothetical protein
MIQAVVGDFVAEVDGVQVLTLNGHHDLRSVIVHDFDVEGASASQDTHEAELPTRGLEPHPHRIRLTTTRLAPTPPPPSQTEILKKCPAASLAAARSTGG